MGDTIRLSQMITGLWVPQVVHAAAELGIADVLAAEPRTARDVAARLGTHPDATERLLAAMATLALCARDGERFALTDLGRCLESEHPRSRRAWARVMGGPAVWRE